eukprot:symbB.v1.2.015583.t2/scaffold1127.1/size253144/5
MPPRPTEGPSRIRRPRQKSDWNSDVAQPLDAEVPSSAPDVVQDRTARMDRTRPRPARVQLSGGAVLKPSLTPIDLGLLASCFNMM